MPSPLQQLQLTFKTFAERECKGKSPLYYQLSHQIAKDDFLLNLCTSARKRQPVPNLFLGAVHDLLLQDREEELADYYP
ncbi:MAG: DUF2332 family protein, partial [Bacteroidota bacterium]